jgi:hypothetical protein
VNNREFTKSFASVLLLGMICRNSLDIHTYQFDSPHSKPDMPTTARMQILFVTAIRKMQRYCFHLSALSNKSMVPIAAVLHQNSTMILAPTSWRGHGYCPIVLHNPTLLCHSFDLKISERHTDSAFKHTLETNILVAF